MLNDGELKADLTPVHCSARVIRTASRETARTPRWARLIMYITEPDPSVNKNGAVHVRANGYRGAVLRVES